VPDRNDAGIRILGVNMQTNTTSNNIKLIEPVIAIAAARRTG
jgi:hypothetical protein